jgi:hypothetical protein
MPITYQSRCYMYFYLFEDTSDDEFQLLSFIWMFKVLASAMKAIMKVIRTVLRTVMRTVFREVMRTVIREVMRKVLRTKILL